MRCRFAAASELQAACARTLSRPDLFGTKSLPPSKRWPQSRCLYHYLRFCLSSFLSRYQRQSIGHIFSFSALVEARPALPLENSR